MDATASGGESDAPSKRASTKAQDTVRRRVMHRDASKGALGEAIASTLMRAYAFGKDPQCMTPDG